MMVMPLFFSTRSNKCRGGVKGRKKKKKQDSWISIEKESLKWKLISEGFFLGCLNDVDDTESLLSPICWAPLYWAF